MRSNWLFLSAAAMLLTCGVGCSSSQVVRGQAPADGVLADNDCEADCDCDECSRRDMRRARRAARRDARQANCHHCVPYSIPHDLSYPPHGDMPGIVQYPYYTVKGPDCFFYDSDGKR